MKFLLDTNAVSEPGRRAPDATFMRWFDAVDEQALYLSALTVGELHRGVALLNDGPQKDLLGRNHAALVRGFADRVLAIDAYVAEIWGALSAELKRTGRVFGAIDELIAATALAHGLVLVTRNARHFEATGCQLLSPWAV